MADKGRINRVTIGGICLERETGGITYANPVAQYANITDERLQEFWHFVAATPAIQQALDECRNKILAELVGWGDTRLKSK
jgi:hypothetical protein